MSFRLSALAGFVVLAVAMLAPSPTLRGQEVIPVDGSQARAWCVSIRERCQFLTDDERAALQVARNEVLDAHLKHLQQRVELGLIPPELAEARIQWITERKEALGGLGSCPRLGSGAAPGAQFRWGERGTGRGGRMGRGWQGLDHPSLRG